MRPLEDILADMQAIIDKPSLTADDVIAYQSLEVELATSQADGSAEPTPGAEGDTETDTDATDTADVTPVANTATTQRAAAAMRARHNAYTRVVVSAGRPSNRRREDAEAESFRNYLRTGRPNADMTPGPQNAQTTGTGSSGGYTVPEGFRAKIVEVIKSFGGVINDAEQLTTETGNPLPYPTNDDTANEAVVTAENTVPASGADIVFGQVQLSAFEYTASGTGGNALAVPLALLQDSAFDIEGFVARKLGMRLARKMARDAVTGTGSAQAQGVLQGITGREISTALSYSDLVDVVMSLDEAYWPGAKWYMNRSSLGTILKLVDGANQLIFKPGTPMLGDANATQISGAIQIGAVLAPVVLDSAFADILLTAGQTVNWGIFGNLSEGYVWRTVRDVEVLVDPYTAVNKRQVQYNAWARADGRQQNISAYKVIAGNT
jgi:HK97 family phage major capsid protein